MKNVANLKTLKGKAFDKAHIDHDVAYHEQVIAAMDKTMIPGAKNDELKALLVSVRPAFVSHLEYARHLQSTMMSSMNQAPAGSARIRRGSRGGRLIWSHDDATVVLRHRTARQSHPLIHRSDRHYAKRAPDGAGDAAAND